jgi:5,10-methylenetetrahydrofolate reductase
MEQLEAFMEGVGTISVPLIMEILPLHSSRQAEFLHNEVAGVSIPAWIRERLRQAGDHGSEVGLEVGTEFIELAQPYVQGISIQADGSIAVRRQLVKLAKAPTSLPPVSLELRDETAVPALQPHHSVLSS